jgi:hypothetical protein
MLQPRKIHQQKYSKQVPPSMCGTYENGLSSFRQELEEKMLLVGMTYVSLAVNKYTLSIYIICIIITPQIYTVLFFPGTKNGPWLLLSHLSLQIFLLIFC